jgi:hypothetical protein
MKNGYVSRFAFPDRRLRYITIHFPSYNPLISLEIGLDKDAALGEGLDYRSELPIVYYGSSITQGGCASRPGNNYQNIVTRALELDHINLGFSGSGRGEDEIVDYMKTLKPYAFVCDFDHNANKEWHVFEIKDNAKLTLSGGVSDDGIFSVEFHDVKSNNVFLFDIQGNGTLVLEAGVNIKIKYPVGDRDAVTAFWLNGEKHSFTNYNGIYVQDDLDAGIINIVVGVTTTITSTGVVQN